MFIHAPKTIIYLLSSDPEIDTEIRHITDTEIGEPYQWLCDLDEVSCSHLISDVVLRDLSLTEAMHPRTFHLFWRSGGFNTNSNVL